MTILTDEMRDKAQGVGIDAYWDYLALVPPNEQDTPAHVTNAILECVNAVLAYALSVERKRVPLP